MLGALARGPRRRMRASSRPGASAGSTPSASSAAAASPSARPARSTRSRCRAPASRSGADKTKTTCTFCGVGCQIDLNVDPETKRIVKITSDPAYLPNEGNLCVKGRFAFNFVHHPDRLTEPLVRGEDGELHETTWEHALEVAARACGG